MTKKPSHSYKTFTRLIKDISALQKNKMVEPNEDRITFQKVSDNVIRNRVRDNDDVKIEAPYTSDKKMKIKAPYKNDDITRPYSTH